MEIDWSKVIGLGIMIPYWGVLIGLLGWGLYKASKREWWRVKYFPRFYLKIVWPARIGNFLKFVGTLTLLFAVLFVIGRYGAYLEGQPFWPPF